MKVNCRALMEQLRPIYCVTSLVVVCVLSGCGQGTGPAKRADHVEIIPDAAKEGVKRISFLELQVPERPPKDAAELLALGKKVYELNCAVCHGVKGDGKGDAAQFLLPRPRSFVVANYRLRTTPVGSLPTDEDLFRSISLGMPGTPMPPWHHILNDEERWALVDYVKSFSPNFKNQAKPETVQLGEPIPKGDEVINEGRELFVKFACNTCHGDKGVGDGPSAAQLVVDAGHKITPRNLTKPSNYKSGYSQQDIVRTVLTGFNGTPMLGYAGAMTTEEAWKIARFIESLVKPEPAVVVQASRDELHIDDVGEPDVRIRVIERAWRYDPETIRVKQGQVIEITFEPTDNGLGVGHGFAVSGYDEVAFLNGAMVGVPKSVRFKVDRAGEFTFYCSTQCSTEKLHPLMNGTLIVEPNETPRTASLN
jgi:cytochrome c oxidase cbb3-type subunit 2